MARLEIGPVDSREEARGGAGGGGRRGEKDTFPCTQPSCWTRESGRGERVQYLPPGSSGEVETPGPPPPTTTTTIKGGGGMEPAHLEEEMVGEENVLIHNEPINQNQHVCSGGKLLS